jgi:DNA-binding CsgD family transcriptional regulator
LSAGEADAGAQIACDLWRDWETRGHLTEGRRVLAGLLDRLDQTAPARPRALWVAGFLALVQADLPAARNLLEASLATAEEAGDVRSVAYASSQLGFVRYYLGEVDRGYALAEKSLTLARQSADQVGVVLGLTQLGFIDLCAGELRKAADRFSECARLAASSGNVWYQGHAQCGLAMATWLLGDPDGAAIVLRDSLYSMRVLEDPIGVALCLDALAWIAASQQKPARAASLLGASEAAWAAIPAVIQPALSAHHEAALDAARAALPAPEYRAAFARGSAMDQAEAVAFALGDSPRPRPEASRAAASPGRLTRREQEVAALVAQGMSNGQIAASLVISVRTVETHVQHIMDKLGCGTRAQIAAWSVGSSPVA